MARGFNGTTDFINLGTSSSLVMSVGPTATICAWAYPISTASPGFVVARDDNTLGRNFAFGVNANFIYAEMGGAVAFSGAGAVSNNVWSHLVWTYNGSQTVAGYVNGVSANSGGSTNPIAATGSVTIGERTFSGSNRWFPGNIAEVGWWTTILTAAEILALAHGARPFTIRPGSLIGYWPLTGLQSPEPDLSGKANNGTLTGTSNSLGPPLMAFTPRWPQLAGTGTGPPPSGAKFRRTRSALGTRIGSRQAIR